MAALPRYERLEDVVAPAGTSPGAQFTVLLAAKEKGRKVYKKASLWKASGVAPKIMEACASVGTHSRQRYRPSAVARARAGSRSARAIDNIVTVDAGVDDWDSEDWLPFEAKMEDIGWQPGPVNGAAGRPMPSFTGAPMGVRNRKLTKHSSARSIMRAVQLTKSFLETTVRLARQHVLDWQSKHSTLDSIERAFNGAELKPEHVELWFAASIRIASLNPAVPASRLYDPKHQLHDAQLVAALPWDALRWMNRHLAFGEYGTPDGASGASASGSGSTAAGELAGGDSAQTGGASDRFRTRRLLSDIARGQAPKAWSPGQHIGFDDLCRTTRHWDGRRIRHKAAVHTGAACDGLNCAHSFYFLYWEENGWLRDPDVASSGVDPGANSGDGGGQGAEPTGVDAREHSNTAERPAARGGRGGCGGRASRGRGRGRRASQTVAVNEPSGTFAPQDTEISGAQAAEAELEAGDAESPEEFTTGANSITSRLQRACKVLQPNVGHCIWVDRGLTNVNAMHSARAAGFHVTGLMQVNRIGLPRRYLAMLKKQMCCRKKCTHDTSSAGCKRFSWTVLHKGEWELQIWSDGESLVIALTSCASGTRLIELTRTIQSECRLALCPEGIGLYNQFGRGPTDGGDQHRKRLSLASRRRLRQGPKGALFDGEIGFVNGTLAARHLRATEMTVWRFCDEFCNDVLASVSMRRRTSALMELATEARRRESTRAGTGSACGAHQPLLYRRASERATSSDAPCAYTSRRGAHTCCEAEDGCEESARPTVFCAGCKRDRDECSGWYHWPCYWKRHRASYVE